MKKKNILTFLSLLFTLSAFAQYQISGTVTNKDNGEGLPGANISLKETGIVVVSGKNGSFSINDLKPGTYTVKADYIGFVSWEKKVTVHTDVQLDMQLEPRVFLAEEVIITATKAHEKTPLTFTNLDEDQINRENTGKDLPYLLSSSPSTVVTSDAGTGVGYTGIRIRGTDLTGINVTLNGVPVNDAESQNVFFVDLPDLASSVDEIQIQRGVGTSSNGAASFGASINIKTDKFMPHVYLELNNAAGSFGTIKNTMKFGSGLIKGKFSID
ncbi:MAG: TonB-dependent receptor, partial [Bacteroidetes bacterium]